MTKQKKAARAVKPRPSVTVPSTVPLFVRALAGIAGEDSTCVGAYLQPAYEQTDTLVDGGAFDADMVKVCVERLLTATEDIYPDELALVQAFEDGKAFDKGMRMAVETVRSFEREATFALGVAFGLRLAGGR